MISINYQALSKLLTECGKALGKTLSDPVVQTTIVTAASASIATGVIVDQIDKKEAKKALAESEEKALLYKKALAEHEAIIKELEAQSDISKERQDYLVDLNERLLKQIEICRNEDTDEQV